MSLTVSMPSKLSKNEFEIDPSIALDFVSAIVAINLGPAGVTSAVGSAANIMRGIKKKTQKADFALAEGFSLYIKSLVEATAELVRYLAPNSHLSNSDLDEIAILVLSSFNSEPLTVSRGAVANPALNPGFIRYRERIVSLFKHAEIEGLDAEKIEDLGRMLGLRFAEICARELANLEVRSHYSNLVDALSRLGELDGDTLWTAYQSHLNGLVYRNLFLHELDGHPSVTLKDVYIQSRGIYLEGVDRDNESSLIDQDADNAARHKVHSFELESHLVSEWIKKDVKKVGNSRLITGGPGTGKSTFSLMMCHNLSQSGYRVVYIPANSIRSFGASLNDIVSKHLSLSIQNSNVTNFEHELADTNLNGAPILVVIDGLDEYDVGDSTVSLAAARLVEHAQKAVDDWQMHGHDVRLLLCGRPESAAALTAQFRKKFHHLHVTGFVYQYEEGDTAVSKSSKDFLAIDQRDLWWRKWQESGREDETGLPAAIRDSDDEGVLEITAQPLLNYMIAVLKLHKDNRLDSLSNLYADLFSKYFERQSDGKFAAFKEICPDLGRFRRIMSEIGVTAWHAGDRSVGIKDLEARFSRPPLKRWLESAGETERGLSAILSAFYTQPEDSVSPEKGLAHRYVFTHKSFREYLTAVGAVRFLEELTRKLDPDEEDGWSDAEAMVQWLAFFGPTPIDQRQWKFIEDELRVSLTLERCSKVLSVVLQVLELALSRRFPNPLATSAVQALKLVGNSEEAIVLLIDAVVKVISDNGRGHEYLSTCNVDWTLGSGRDLGRFELFELLHRLRSRPGCPDEMILAHLNGLFSLPSIGLQAQLNTKFKNRADTGRAYAVTIDLTGAILVDINLRGTNLTHARFHRTEVLGCDLSGADLGGANFAYAHVNGSKFAGTEVANMFTYGASFWSDEPNGSGVDGDDIGSMGEWFESNGAVT